MNEQAHDAALGVLTMFFLLQIKSSQVNGSKLLVNSSLKSSPGLTKLVKSSIKSSRRFSDLVKSRHTYPSFSSLRFFTHVHTSQRKEKIHFQPTTLGSVELLPELQLPQCYGVLSAALSKMLQWVVLLNCP